ncbi:MAG: hypothetical protein ACKO67_03560 [Bacteroidota bacterium]
MNAQSVVAAISHVLHEHECAVVPGFGSFILRKNFGIANPFSGQIKPASHSIYFNADIKEDDGFVANALKEHFGYSFKQASQSLIDFGNQITEVTLSNGNFRLGVLGAFHRNPVGELFFLADANLNLSLQTFGLPNIHWQWKAQVSQAQITHTSPIGSIVSNDVPSLEIEPSSNTTEEVSQSTSIQPEEMPLLTEEEQHSNFTVSKRSQPWLWRAAASFSIISIGAGILMTVAQIWSVSSGQDLASLMPQDSQVQQIQHKPSAHLSNEIHSIKEEVDTNSSISHSIDYGTGAEGISKFYESLLKLKGKYSVFGGSYITLELANRECLLWQKLGIDACVVSVKRSSLHKVVLGKFSDEERASHFAESIKNMPTGTLSVSDVALDWK